MLLFPGTRIKPDLSHGESLTCSSKSISVHVLTQRKLCQDKYSRLELRIVANSSQVKTKIGSLSCCDPIFVPTTSCRNLHACYVIFAKKFVSLRSSSSTISLRVHGRAIRWRADSAMLLSGCCGRVCPSTLSVTPLSGRPSSRRCASNRENANLGGLLLHVLDTTTC